VGTPTRLCGGVVVILLLTAATSVAAQDVTVTLDPATRYQTILGWGKTTPWQAGSDLLRDQTIERSVNDLGLNRLRYEGMCGNKLGWRSFEWLNDNNDPFSINWDGFDTAPIDQRAEEWLVPWKRAVDARGEPFDLYVSPSFFRGGSSGDVPPWLLADPEEYAEWATALLLRLRDMHGIEAQWYSICNEAGNDNAFSPEVVGRCIAALAPRLKALGFATRTQFPECVNAHESWRYIDALRDNQAVWDAVGLLSYHWYGGDNQSAMARIRDFAVERGLPTAQTEFMDLTMDHLYDDMTIGGTSYWEVYGLCGPDYEATLSHVSSTTYSAGPWYWRFRQASHYVRPGAVRIGAASSDPSVRVLAFDRDGRRTTVLINTTAPSRQRTVRLSGLRPGTYGLSHCVGQQPYEERGLSEVGPAGDLELDLAPNSVLTVYPHADGNLPPTVTEWRAAPDFLTMPAASVELRCSAVDPERDRLSVEWSVASAPGGAQPVLADHAAPSTIADGLTAAGDYVFAARVSDGTHTVTRKVLVRVFDGNQPPVPIDVHNRKPVWVTTRDEGTLLRCGAWDIEGDAVSYRWRVASQPADGAAVLATPDEPACKVTGLTVAGDYVFELEVRDPTHVVTLRHTVPVYDG